MILIKNKARGISAPWLYHSLVGNFSHSLANFTHSILLES